MSRKQLFWLKLAALISALVLTGCTGAEPGTGAGKAKKHLVEVAPARMEVMSHTSEKAGTLRALREIRLFNQEEGSIVEAKYREGDVVEKGAVLVRLDDRLLRAQLDKAKARLKQAEFDNKRLQALKAKRLVSEEALLKSQTSLEVARAEARLLQTRLEYMVIRAPFSGRISERRIEPGDVAPKHSHLLTFVDPSQLVTEVQISELVLPNIRIGDKAQVKIDALGRQLYPGRVLRIFPTIDPATRLGTIEVALDPVPEGARAGQFCRVTLSAAKKKRLVVAFSALRRDQDGEYVFIVDENDKAQRIAVTSGLRTSSRIEVLDGLKPGQVVIIKGFLGLSDGKRIRIAGQKKKAGDKKPGKAAITPDKQGHA